MPRTIPVTKYSPLTDIKHLGPYFRGEMVTKHKIHNAGELYQDLCSMPDPKALETRIKLLTRNRQANEMLESGRVCEYNKKLAWSLYRLMATAAGRPEFDGYIPRVDLDVIEHLQTELLHQSTS